MSRSIAAASSIDSKVTAMQLPFTKEQFFNLFVAYNDIDETLERLRKRAARGRSRPV
jgi:hypothetical protein